MGTYMTPPKSSVAKIPGMNTSEGFNTLGYDDDFMTTDYGQQDLGLDPTVDTGNGISGLLGNVGNYLGSDGGSGLLKGLTGAYGMYLASRQQKDNEKNNSLYRRIQENELAHTNQYRDKWSQTKWS